MKKGIIYILFLLISFPVFAQNDITSRFSQNMGQTGNTFNPLSKNDSTKQKDRFVPTEVHQWTIDDLLGTVTPVASDTIHHQYQNWHFTEGMNGEYNFLGNLGSPRESRIFFNRPPEQQFIFLQPYDYFITQPDQLRFTDTKSPFTNLSYQSSGDKVDGDDRFRAYFSTSANRHFGVGFLFDYLYGRGRYDSQSTAFTNFSLFSYYRNIKYGFHFYIYNNHIKMAENGGITDDNYITNPESMAEGKKQFQPSDIPVNLASNWNRNENLNIFFTHHYNIGFYREELYVPDGENIILTREEKRKIKKNSNIIQLAADSINTDSLLTTALQIDSIGRDSALLLQNPLIEPGDSIIRTFIPVTRFTHTANIQSNERQYIAYQTPANYYAKDYLINDSVDKTKNLSIKNTVAISLLEGFNKWVQAGLTAYATYDYNSYNLPDSVAGSSRETRTKYNEHNILIGGILQRDMGKTLHFKVQGETVVAGEDLGSFSLKGSGDLNFKLWNDTVHLKANAYIKNSNPNFYFRNYHSQHYWWNNNLSKEFRTRIMGNLSIDRWKTDLQIGIENIKNYTYFANTSVATTVNNNTTYLNNVSVEQSSENIQIFSATLKQNFALGPLHLDLEATYQKSSNEQVIPLPQFNGYANLYFAFKFAKVLDIEAGGDIRYFTGYYAPDYSPALGQFYQQNSNEKIEIGDYPVINVYLNFNLKRTRFYVMYYHINSGSGNLNSFLVPHYPINPGMLMLGLSWDFYD